MVPINLKLDTSVGGLLLGLGLLSLTFGKKIIASGGEPTRAILSLYLMPPKAQESLASASQEGAEDHTLDVGIQVQI